MDVPARCVFILSSVPAMLENAGALLTLANQHPEQERTLAASASIIVAAALDQGTKTVLSSVVAQPEDPRHSDCSQLVTETLRRRVTRLPEILTGGRRRLLPRTPEVQALHDLITLRNDLMHVNEEAETQMTSIPWPMPESHQISIAAPQIDTRWFSVRLAQATTYRDAVERYAAEVLFPPSGEIERGTIVGVVG